MLLALHIDCGLNRGLVGNMLPLILTLLLVRKVFDKLSAQLYFSVLVRLADGRTPFKGRVEVYYQDQWGTVCDDGWSIEDANVVCRQLGYPPASKAWQRAQFGPGSGPILLDRVACDGNESSIDQCDHNGWFNHSCSHGEDAGVTCGEDYRDATSSLRKCMAL